MMLQKYLIVTMVISYDNVESVTIKVLYNIKIQKFLFLPRAWDASFPIIKYLTVDVRRRTTILYILHK